MRTTDHTRASDWVRPSAGDSDHKGDGSRRHQHFVFSHPSCMAGCTEGKSFRWNNLLAAAQDSATTRGALMQGGIPRFCARENAPQRTPTCPHVLVTASRTLKKRESLLRQTQSQTLWCSESQAGTIEVGRLPVSHCRSVGRLPVSRPTYRQCAGSLTGSDAHYVCR